MVPFSSGRNSQCQDKVGADRLSHLEASCAGVGESVLAVKGKSFFIAFMHAENEAPFSESARCPD